MLFKNSVRTSKRTPYFTITKINWLTLFKFSSVSVELQSTLGRTPDKTRFSRRKGFYWHGVGVKDVLSVRRYPFKMNDS
jgi:hypothetical protein